MAQEGFPMCQRGQHETNSGRRKVEHVDVYFIFQNDEWVMDTSKIDGRPTTTLIHTHCWFEGYPYESIHS
jgi:hypothetical protein